MESKEENPLVLVTWQEVLQNLNTKFKGFETALSKQYGKKRTKNFSITLDECLNRVTNQEPNKNIGLNGALLDPPILCLDLDSSEVGKQLINLILNPQTRELVQKNIGNPLIVQTPSENRLHLYYKTPFKHQKGLLTNAEGQLKSFKRTTTTRLGFQIEYTYDQATFAGSGYQLLCGPTLDEVPELPPALYPYNYVGDPNAKCLVELKGTLMKEGKRNNEFFRFFAKDNFSFNHVYLANLLCCEDAMTAEEVQTLSEIPSREDKSLRQLSDTYYTFSFKMPIEASNLQAKIRLRPGERPPQVDYNLLISEGSLRRDTAFALKDMGFNPERAKQARLAKRTVESTILYVSLMENFLDLFREDELWMGESLLGTACILLIKTNHLHVKFIESESAYYAYNNNIWEIITEIELSSLVNRISQNLCKFQNIGASTDLRAISTVVKTHCSYSSWPYNTSGFNFLNGSLILSKDKTVTFQKHDPRHNFRRLIKINYDPNQYLTPYEVRFLLDFANEQTYLLNLLRLILYFCLESGGNQVAAFITGDPGGSKSTLLALIQRVVSGCSNVTKANSISQRFQLLSLVRGQNLLLFNDLAENSLSSESSAVLKKLISGEPVSDEIRYIGNFEFTPRVFVMLTTNYEAQEFEAFQDSAIADRLLVTPAPTIDSLHRMSDFIERLGESSQNFSGIVNWALNTSAEFPTQINRASDLNNIISPARTLVDSFVLERLCYKPDHFMSFKDLRELYNAYAQEVAQSSMSNKNKDSNTLTVRRFASLMRDFSKRTSEHTPLRDGRTTDEKGFKNIDIRALTSTQGNGYTPFELKANEKLTQMLRSDPFKNYGILMRNLASQYSQLPPVNNQVELATKMAAKAVINISSKILMESVSFPTYKPHSHLQINVPLVGPKVYQHKEWNQIPDVLPNRDQTKHNPFLAETISREATKIVNQVPIQTNESVIPPLNEILIQQEEVDKVEDVSSTELTKQTLNQSNELANLPLIETKETQTEVLNNNVDIINTEEELEQKGSGHPKKKGRKARALTKISLKPYEVNILSKYTELDKSQVKSTSNWIVYQEIFEASLLDQDSSKGLPTSLDTMFKESFNLAKQNLKKCATLIQTEIEREPLQLYTTFDKVYPNVRTVELIRSIFLCFPFYGPIQIINQLNHFFLDRMQRSFAVIRDHRSPTKSDYFYNTLPGTNTKSKEVTNYQSILDSLPLNIKESTDIKSEHFMWEGQSLLPLAYEPGDKAYGRLKSIPNKNLSTLKGELKRTILKTISSTTKLRFVELDMRAAHTLVFKALTSLKGEEKAKFPSVDKQWAYLVNEFYHILEKESTNKSTLAKDIITKWDSSNIKGIIKVQWYQALNSGPLFNPTANLKNNKNKLNLKEEEVIPVAQTCQAVFEQIDLFKLLKSFQQKVNRRDFIFIPTEVTPFDTKTLSKKQEALQKAGKDPSKFPKMTGMSRIFSSCELVLIILVFLIISDMPDIIPLAYEADGLLLAGYFEDQERLLKDINNRFAPLAQQFMNEEFSLEFKNLT